MRFLALGASYATFLRIPIGYFSVLPISAVIGQCDSLRFKFTMADTTAQLKELLLTLSSSVLLPVNLVFAV